MDADVRIAQALAAFVLEHDAQLDRWRVVHATPRAAALGLRVGGTLAELLDGPERVRLHRERSSLRASEAHTLTVSLTSGVPIRLEERVLSRNPDGTVHEIVGVIGEATESPMESLRFLTALLNTLPDPVFVKDREHRFIAINDGFAQFIGRRRDEVLGRADADFFPPDQVRVFWEHDDRVLQSDEVDENEEELTDAAGRNYVISTRKASFIDPDGRRVLVGVFRDVTERRRLERDLITAARAKTDFVANISHELRTPLNGILGMAQLLARRKLGPAELEYLDVITASGQALLALVDDVLDFSKIEAGRLDIVAEPFSPGDVVEGACAVFAASAARRGVELVVRLAPDLPERLSGDAGRVRQIVINLVSNAVKFTERGEVVVDVAVAGGRFVVAVKDTGVGLEEAVKERLFLPFTQADASITRRYGGTGLGLAISQRLARLMGGEISAEGRSGDGSRFTLDVPTVVVEASAPPPRLRCLTRARVEIAQPSVRAHLEAELRRAGLALARSEGAGGEGALDVTFVDEASAASAAPRRGPVVVVGAEATGGNAAHHLVKPVRRARLASLLVRLDREIEESSGPGKASEGPPSLLRGRALVVDDSAVNARVLELMLAHAGVTAAVASNGLRALEILDREPFDVVLMDCQMPELDGFEAARRIRGGSPAAATPIVGVTADATPEAIARCYAAGMNAVLVKPVGVEALVAVLARFVARTVEHDTARQPR